MRFTGDSVAIAVHALVIARFTGIDRGSASGTSIITSAPEIARLWFPCTHYSCPDSEWLYSRKHSGSPVLAERETTCTNSCSRRRRNGQQSDCRLFVSVTMLAAVVTAKFYRRGFERLFEAHALN